MKKNKEFIFVLFFVLFACFNSIATEKNSSLDVIEKVEKNLIYAKEVLKTESSDVIIKKGAWTQEDTKKFEQTAPQRTKINATITKTKQDKTSIALKRKAFDAMGIGQYEVAVKLYKNSLKLNNEDMYANLGLATAYQYLGQYTQAKPLYLKVLQVFPTDQQVMANLLSIITNETPYEAVYLISNIADKNKLSPIFQAQASLAYSKVKNYSKAIEYIKKSIELEQNNLEYRYNLAVLEDLNQNYSQAKVLYNDLLAYSESNNEAKYNLPIQNIKNRLNTLTAISKNKKKNK